MQFKRLVLPAPFGPMMATNSPVCTARLILLSAVIPPKRKVSSFTSSSARLFSGRAEAKRASFELTFLAPVQPVPATSELLPGSGIRMIELDGLTAEPRRMGQGEYTYVGFVYRATGIKGDTNSPLQAPKSAAPAVNGSKTAPTS